MLRGLHYQCPPTAQAKLVWVIQGAVFDVVVDLRRGSPTYGRWYGLELSATNFLRLMTGVVSAPLGYGHTAFDIFSKGKGANYLGLMTVAEEPGTGLSTWTASEVKIA